MIYFTYQYDSHFRVNEMAPSSILGALLTRGLGFENRFVKLLGINFGQVLLLRLYSLVKWSEWDMEFPG